MIFILWTIVNDKTNENPDLLFYAVGEFTDGRTKYYVTVQLDNSRQFWLMSSDFLDKVSDPIANKDYYSVDKYQDVLKIAINLIEDYISSIRMRHRRIESELHEKMVIEEKIIDYVPLTVGQVRGLSKDTYFVSSVVPKIKLVFTDVDTQETSEFVSYAIDCQGTISNRPDILVYSLIQYYNETFYLSDTWPDDKVLENSESLFRDDTIFSLYINN